MPDTTYLQIEEADTDAVRVVELPGAAIRVGRGTLCEVRLTDPELAEVQCLLRRRGTTWHVQPLGPAGLVSLAGQAVDQLRPLPPDEPLRVGSFRLLIRHEGGDRFRRPIEIVGSAERGALAMNDDVLPPSNVAAGRGEGDADHLRRWQTRVELRERWLQARQEEKKWEARWRAAGEGLRARNSSSAGHRAPDEPNRSDGGLAAGPVGRAASPNPTMPANRSVSPEEDALRKGHRRALTVSEASGSGSPPDLKSDATAPTRSEPILPKLTEPDADDAVGTASRSLRLPSQDLETGTAPDSTTLRIDLDGEPDDASAIASGTMPTESVDPVERPSVETSWPRGPSDEPSQVVSPPSGHAAGPSHAEIAPPSSGGRARVEWRDASAILAAQGRRVVNEPTVRPRVSRKTSSYGFPTDPEAPAQWSVPAWLALPTAGLGALATLSVGLMLALSWTADNSSAGLAALAALRADDGKPVMLDPSERIETQWWKTTASHLSLWSAAIERSPDGANRVDEVRDALDAARRSAPLESSTRYASAQTVGGWERPSSVAAVGLSRDVTALTLTARTLKRSGKTEAALRAYRLALELAADADPSRLAAPAFDDDPQVRRFRLPHEAIVGAVIREIIEAGEWGFSAWSSALPPRAVVRLTAARILREKGDTDAERAFGLVLADDVTAPASAILIAEELAARGEALALTERRREAAERYREAIAIAADDAIRRRWRLALAEVLTPLGESGERAALLEAAKASDPTDDVTRKAIEAQQFAGLK